MHLWNAYFYIYIKLAVVEGTKPRLTDDHQPSPDDLRGLYDGEIGVAYSRQIQGEQAGMEAGGANE